MLTTKSCAFCDGNDDDNDDDDDDDDDEDNIDDNNDVKCKCKSY